MQYELLYIIPAQYTDEEIGGTVEKVTKILEDTGVKITRNENLGKLKLAYPIKHVRHGFYVLVEFEADAEKIRRLERELRLMPEVLRHQTIRLERKLKEGEEKKEIKMISYEAPGREEEKPAPRPREEKRVAPKKKVNLEELDKKLDEILESDVKV